ncbi:MAG: glycerol-3-phosphate acyltransferase [Acidimicrobiales bacterium]
MKADRLRPATLAAWGPGSARSSVPARSVLAGSAPERSGRSARSTQRPAATTQRPAATTLALAYLAGSLPFSNLAAIALRGIDLRRVGTGTVSGTALYQVAGFGPLAVAGSLDLAKGALGARLGHTGGPGLRAFAAGMTVAGHNWSPWLRGAGGRGLAPALGASLVLSPSVGAVLALGLGGGRLLSQTGGGCFWAMLAVFPVLAVAKGRDGVRDAAAIVAPMLGKRLLGNHLPTRPGLGVSLNRLVLDRDGPTAKP